MLVAEMLMRFYLLCPYSGDNYQSQFYISHFYQISKLTSELDKAHTAYARAQDDIQRLNREQEALRRSYRSLEESKEVSFRCHVAFPSELSPSSLA